MPCSTVQLPWGCWKSFRTLIRYHSQPNFVKIKQKTSAIKIRKIFWKLCERYWYIIREQLQFIFAQESNKSCSTLHSIVCSQRSCAVLSHCFTDCTCAWESGFFVYKLVAGATNWRTIVSTTKFNHDLYDLSLKLMVLHGLLRWKLEMHILLQQNDMQSKQHNCGVDLHWLARWCHYCYWFTDNSVPVDNSLIFWSTSTTRAGWVGLLLKHARLKNWFFTQSTWFLTTSLVPDLYTHICWREKSFPFLSFIWPKESNHYVSEWTVVYHSKHAKFYESCNQKVCKVLDRPQINEWNHEFKPCLQW